MTSVARTSSSRHRLSADGGLNRWDQVVFLAANAANNAFPSTNVDPRLRFMTMRPSRQVLDRAWPLLDTGTTPARRLSDLFWLLLPWGAVRDGAGGEIHLVDVGCGNGSYATRLESYSGGRIASYHGIDMKKRAEWDNIALEHGAASFATGSSDDVASLLPHAANMIVTQSAIEHFIEDLRFFEALKDARTGNQQQIQIHMCPSTACLTNYLFHGVRQYSPRTISRITRLYPSDYTFALVGLGGRECNRIHRRWITWPKRLQGRDGREQHPELYETELRTAVETDIASGDSGRPSFYALVICTKDTGSIFEQPWW